MNPNEKKIPFKVEFSRILELFAAQIYQSPLALLRENTQNAFDAVLMKGHSQRDDLDYEPAIRVTVDSDKIVVADNGIGMTSDEIETNYWYAGRSGKNTSAARAAGVVGTFGIGAMANFGVAEELSVESESGTGQRTHSSVRKSELSTEFDSISLSNVPPLGQSGTSVCATLAQPGTVAVSEAKDYLKEFVRFVDVPVYFNEDLISGAAPRSILPSPRYAWTERISRADLAGLVVADLDVYGMATGELRVVVENLVWELSTDRPGVIVLLQERAGIQTLRSGFGLSTVALQSTYQWGGVADIPVLKPTAGREALDAQSNQLLHDLIRAVDECVSDCASRHEESYSNECFLRWIVSRRKFSLCGPMQVEPRPNRTAERLDSLARRAGLHYYTGRDETVVRTYASDDQPLVVISRISPRRDCELGFLRSKQIPEIDTRPKVLAELSVEEQSIAQIAVAMRISRTLEDDYFLPNEVRYGTITGDLPVLVYRQGPPTTIFLNPETDTVQALFALYDREYRAFGAFVKDFIRTTVFSRIEHIVPSSTKEGAEQFLRHLRSNRDPFEYSDDDRGDLDEIFEELRAGRLTTVEAARRLIDMDQSTLNVTGSSTAPISTVVSEASSEDLSYDPRPGVDRRDVESSARILTSTDSSVNGYTCFLSLTDRVHREKGDFFLQPHSTEVVWSGQKVIFVFQHHSGRFGLYYDILCPRIIGSSGGGRQVSSSLLAKDRIFIPVPAEISEVFMPTGSEVIRLDVRCDVLYLEDDVTSDG